MQIDKGKAGEYIFAESCVQRGLAVCFPCSELLPYDYVVDNGERLLKVQVKYSTCIDRGRIMFRVQMTSTRSKYTSADTDYVVLITRKRTIYIIPIAELTTSTLRVSGKAGCRWAKYKNAWHYLLPRKRK